MLDLLDQAIERLPDEVRASRWLLKDRDEFLDRTQREADDILAAARGQAERMVQRSEVMKAAEAKARRIMENARAEASRQRNEADDFCDKRLAQLETVLERTMTVIAAGRAKLRGPAGEGLPAGGPRPGRRQASDGDDDPGRGASTGPTTRRAADRRDPTDAAVLRSGTGARSLDGVRAPLPRSPPASCSATGAPGSRSRSSGPLPGLALSTTRLTGDDVVADVVLEAQGETVTVTGTVTAAAGRASAAAAWRPPAASSTVELSEVFEPDPVEGETYPLGRGPPRPGAGAARGARPGPAAGAAVRRGLRRPRPRGPPGRRPTGDDDRGEPRRPIPAGRRSTPALRR